MLISISQLPSQQLVQLNTLACLTLSTKIRFYKLYNAWHEIEADRADHGRPQKLFLGSQRRHFADLFQVADVAMQMDVHKTIYSFYTTMKMPHESTRSMRIYFEIFFKWSCIRVCHKDVLSVIRYRLCWIGT